MLNRIFSSAIAGWSAAKATFQTQDFTPYAEYGFDGVYARRNRYVIYSSYEYNQTYDPLMGFAQQIKDAHRLYKFIRGIYNPVARSKNILVSNIYQGAINREVLTIGAMPLEFDNRNLVEPIQAVIKASNLESQLPRYTGQACIKGDTAWWIVDDPISGRVRMEALDPAKIYDAEFDAAGNVKAAIIEYTRFEEQQIKDRPVTRTMTEWYTPQNNQYLFTMKVFKIDGACRFQTFKNGEPFAFFADAEGNKRATWDVPYDFVPLVIRGFSRGEGNWYLNSFYNCMNKIDYVNDGASLLLDQVRKTVVAILKARGIRKGNLNIDMNSPSGIPIAYIDDPEADLQPLINQLDLEGARHVLEDAKIELMKDMPELMFEEGLQRNERPTEPGIRAVMSPAIGRIEDARRNLDPGTASAIQMSITIGAIRGYDGFRGKGITLESYDRGQMELRIKERPVIADDVSAKERVGLYTQIASLPVGYQRKALQDLNVSEPEITKMVEEPQQAEPPTEEPNPDDRVQRARLRLDGATQALGAANRRNGNREPA